jgi:hypothetical protein
MKTDAKSRYSRLETERSPVLEKAREASDLTLPGLIPRDGQNDATLLAQPYQSLGARGVNNLASKILLALFPPGSPFIRHELNDPPGVQRQPQELERIRVALSRIESRVSLRAERERAILWSVIVHLVVAGNLLFYHPRGKDPQVFGIHQYVIRRNPAGRAREAIVKEAMSPSDLSRDILAKAKVPFDRKEPVDVYTVVEWTDTSCRWWQELNGEVITEVSTSPIDVCPWLPLLWKYRPGKHWAESHVMEMLGDLMSYEGMSKAIFKFAELASKVIYLDNPNSTTDIEELRKAESGDFVQGSMEDITVLQLDKYADFRVVDAVMQRLEQRLAAAFLLQTGVVRDAERVTAEEIRAVAQELEDGLGGVYSILASGFQWQYAKRLIHELELEGEVPRLPKTAVRITIVTGFEALGRAHSTNRIRALIADARNMLGDGAVQYFRTGNVLSRMAVGLGVEDIDEIIKADDEVMEEQQQAQMSAALQEAAPGLMQDAIGSGLNEEQ